MQRMNALDAAQIVGAVIGTDTTLSIHRALMSNLAPLR